MVATVNVKIQYNNLPELIQRAPVEVDAAMRALASHGEAYVKNSFGSAPPGRVSTRGSRTHVAASPGYPPNVDIGTLRASIHVERMGRMHYQIADGVEYGQYLEFGSSRHNFRWPFMGPMAVWLEDQVAGVFGHFLE